MSSFCSWCGQLINIERVIWNFGSYGGCQKDKRDWRECGCVDIMTLTMRHYFGIKSNSHREIKWVDGDGWCVRALAGLSGCWTGSSSDITFGHMPQQKPNQTLPSFVSITRQKMFFNKMFCYLFTSQPQIFLRFLRFKKKSLQCASVFLNNFM